MKIKLKIKLNQIIELNLKIKLNIKIKLDLKIEFENWTVFVVANWIGFQSEISFSVYNIYSISKFDSIKNCLLHDF